MRAKLLYIIAAGILLLAIYVRLDLSPRVFPAQSDATHFVEAGIRMAQTSWRSITGWAYAPQFLAMWAHQLGVSPHKTLQYSTVFFGVMAILGGMALMRSLTGNSLAMIVFGLLLACNPIMIHASISGLSEMPAIALFLVGASLITWGWQERIHCIPIVGTIIVALGLYYRPIELIISIAVFLGPIVIMKRKTFGRTDLALVAGMIAAFLTVGAGYVVLSRSTQDGDYASIKMVNIAFGEYGYTSKAIEGRHLLGEEKSPLLLEVEHLEAYGIWRYLIDRRQRIAHNYRMNVMRGIRQFNDHLFSGSARMGTLWYVTISIVLVAWLIKSCQMRLLLIPVAYPYLLLGLLSLSFVHPRWTSQGIPFLLMGLAGGCVGAWAGLRNVAWARVLAVLCFGAFLYSSVSRGYELANDQWRDLNIYDVARRLKDHVEEENRLMTFNLYLAPLVYETNFNHVTRIPYGSIDVVERVAARRGVDFVVLNDSLHADYPVQQAFDEKRRPPNWRVIDLWEYSRYTRFGYETDRYLLIRRDGVIIPGAEGDDAKYSNDNEGAHP